MKNNFGKAFVKNSFLRFSEFSNQETLNHDLLYIILVLYNEIKKHSLK